MRKNNKKIMKTKLQESYKCSCPNIKRIKGKLSKLPIRPFIVLKISILFFPTKASQKARRHHLPHNNTLKCYHQSTSKQTSQLPVDITQDNPKQLKKAFHKAQATSQWRNK
jgi:hypothetical protein